MCLIIHKPAGVERPTHADLLSLVSTNPDGAGLAFRTKRGQIMYQRSANLLAADIDKTLDTRTGLDTDVVMHARIATQGIVSNKNTQPMPMTHGVFAHNGNIITSEMSTEHPTWSDTRVLIEYIINPLLDRPTVLDNVLHLLARQSYSRFVLMTSERTQRYGNWHEDTKSGLWYSHRPYTTYTGTQTDTVYSRDFCDLCGELKFTTWHVRAGETLVSCRDCEPYIDDWLGATVVDGYHKSTADTYRRLLETEWQPETCKNCEEALDGSWHWLEDQPVCEGCYKEAQRRKERLLESPEEEHEEEHEEETETCARCGRTSNWLKGSLCADCRSASKVES